MTGYRRNEIIPRNCRFVQSEQTDREALRRIKEAVAKREESVELILNRRKTGEPFWNLLYITPLFDNNGKLVFFLGGQINCSTTIHSTSDVLRILAQSRDGADDDDVRPFSPQTIKQPLIRRLGRASNKVEVQQRLPGQEDELVAKLGNMDLQNQFKIFYSAYSHVCFPLANICSVWYLGTNADISSNQFVVINYSTMLIAFASNGLIDLLFPIKARTAYQALAVGTDIFKFLYVNRQNDKSNMNDLEADHLKRKPWFRIGQLGLQGRRQKRSQERPADQYRSQAVRASSHATGTVSTSLHSS